MIWPLLLHCFIFLKQGSDHVALKNKIIHCLFTSINKTPEQSLPQSVHLALYCICTLLFSSPIALCSWKPKFLICSTTMRKQLLPTPTPGLTSSSQLSIWWTPTPSGQGLHLNVSSGGPLLTCWSKLWCVLHSKFYSSKYQFPIII